MSYGIDQQVQQRVDAYRGQPEKLQQSYAQNQQLIDLLALQKIKSEKEAAMRNMQSQMQTNPQTIAQQREQELMQMTQQEMAQQQGALMKQQAQQRPAMPPQGMPPQAQGIASAPAPNMQKLARGGVVGFAGPDGSYVNSLLSMEPSDEKMLLLAKEALRRGATKEEIINLSRGNIRFEGNTPVLTGANTGQVTPMDSMGLRTDEMGDLSADLNATQVKPLDKSALGGIGDDPTEGMSLASETGKPYYDPADPVKGIASLTPDVMTRTAAAKMPTSPSNMTDREYDTRKRMIDMQDMSPEDRLAETNAIRNETKLDSPMRPMADVVKQPEYDGITRADTASGVAEPLAIDVVKPIPTGDDQKDTTLDAAKAPYTPKTIGLDVATEAADWFDGRAGYTPEERAGIEGRIADKQKLYDEINDPRQAKWDRLLATMAAAGGSRDLGIMGRNMVATSQQMKDKQNSTRLQGLEAIQAMQQGVVDKDQAVRFKGADLGLGTYNSEADRQVKREANQIAAETKQLLAQQTDFAKYSAQLTKVQETINQMRASVEMSYMARRAELQKLMQEGSETQAMEAQKQIAALDRVIENQLMQNESYRSLRASAKMLESKMGISLPNGGGTADTSGYTYLGAE